jgi:hypothetical protein
METTIQRDPPSTEVDHSRQTVDDPRGAESITTTEARHAAPHPTAGAGTIGAGAAIFRRLERRSRLPRWALGVMLGVAAAIATVGVIGYQTVLQASASQSAAPGQTTSPEN